MQVLACAGFHELLEFFVLEWTDGAQRQSKLRNQRMSLDVADSEHQPRWSSVADVDGQFVRDFRI